MAYNQAQRTERGKDDANEKALGGQGENAMTKDMAKRHARNCMRRGANCECGWEQSASHNRRDEVSSSCVGFSRIGVPWPKVYLRYLATLAGMRRPRQPPWPMTLCSTRGSCRRWQQRHPTRAPSERVSPCRRAVETAWMHADERSAEKASRTSAALWWWSTSAVPETSTSRAFHGSRNAIWGWLHRCVEIGPPGHLICPSHSHPGVNRLVTHLGPVSLHM